MFHIEIEGKGGWIMGGGRGKGYVGPPLSNYWGGGNYWEEQRICWPPLSNYWGGGGGGEVGGGLAPLAAPSYYAYDEFILMYIICIIGREDNKEEGDKTKKKKKKQTNKNKKKKKNK